MHRHKEFKWNKNTFTCTFKRLLQERTIFQNNEDLIAQYETADDLTESYNIGENCEVVRLI